MTVLLRLPEVLKRTGMGKTALYEAMRADFPKSVALGGRSVGWVEAEIEGWIQQRIQASRKFAEGTRASAREAASCACA